MWGVYIYIVFFVYSKIELSIFSTLMSKKKKKTLIPKTNDPERSVLVDRRPKNKERKKKAV